jgi:pyruvate/2-oxoglutarate dehydrogenase complex dihydrolipoamide acyltransferase (E2) component
MAEVVFVTIPQETVNDESVRILSWHVASGSRVEKDQPLCEVETSKAVMDIEAPVSGVVVYSAAAGDELPVGETICQIVPEGVDPATVAPAASVVSAAAPKVVVPIVPVTTAIALVADKAAETVLESRIAEADLRPARLTPLAAKLATEFGFATESFTRGSLVRRDDVLRRAGKLPPGPRASVAAPTDAPCEKAAEQAENAASVAGVVVEWTELPRRKVFEAKVLSQGQARTVQSQVTSSLRAPQLRARLERVGLTNVGLGALIVFEAARLLRKYPEFNAVHDRGWMGKYSDVNIGWAIDGGQGLKVPVIPLADQKTPSEIVEIMLRQIDGYVAGTLSTVDFLGGTFTISDLSTEGISHFHPLISQGHSAILGVGGELDGAGNETLYLTLAFDHQLAEGRKAAQFVRELAGRLEAHGALDAAAPQAAPTAENAPYCALCHRDREELRAMKAMLVLSEIPAGFVCSLCLAELS